MSITFKILDSNLDYNDIDKFQYEKLLDLVKYSAWKNDIVILHLVVKSDENIDAIIKLKHSKFIESKIYKVKKNLAYSGEPVPPIPLYTYENRVEVSDILLNTNEASLIKGKFQSFFIELHIQKDCKSGIQDVEIVLDTSSYKSIFSKKIEIEVSENIVDKSDKFDIELWQYPYRIAEYYDLNPFSMEHFDALRKQLKPYKDLGGEFITATLCEDAWDGQTYGDKEVKYPSMIKWNKEKDIFTFDYTDFDKWINFCIEEKLGSKIIVYGMAPWHESFTYYENNELIYKKYDLSNEEHIEIFVNFLKDFYNHLEDIDIFDNIYLGIDERGFSKEIFEIINSVKNSKGKTAKIAAAIDNYIENAKYADMVNHVSVSLIEFEKDRERFYNFLEDRRNKGFDTMLYSCVGHKPGNFSLSQPAETYYTVVSTALTDGFLRWAYDAWVKDPLLDTSHRLFEPGDCFLVYPSLDDSHVPNISIRLLKIKEALYDVYKLRKINELGHDIKSLLNNSYTKFLYSREYLDNKKIEILLNDIIKIKKILEIKL